MADPRFFEKSHPLNLAKVAEMTGARLQEEDAAQQVVEDVAPLDRATHRDLSFLDNPKYVESFTGCKAGAVLVREKHAGPGPAGAVLLVTDDPYRAYARIAQHFYPFVPQSEEISPSACIDASATFGADCIIGPGAFIGRGVEIGDRCIIGPNAVIYEGVKIGDDTRIGALSSVSHTYIGDRVILHRGVHIGQDGFGFALHAQGHLKVPQLGRVMIGDDVEIGAGTCIDRGTGPDTVIGEGAKIDNLVQIGHNVQIGKGAVVVAQVGIAGSARIGDGVVLGGQAGVAGHLRIGAGAKLAAQSGVIQDIPPGATFGGSPALPIKDWHRQTITLARMTRKKGAVS